MSKLGSASKKVLEKIGVTKPRQITCRFSVNHDTWVEVDPKNLDQVIKELPVPCYLTDVKFSTHTIYENAGCGSRVEGKAGVASGTLRLSLPRGTPKTGYENLGFNRSGFHSAGFPLTSARVLFLENSRFAKVLV